MVNLPSYSNQYNKQEHNKWLQLTMQLCPATVSRGGADINVFSFTPWSAAHLASNIYNSVEIFMKILNTTNLN